MKTSFGKSKINAWSGLKELRQNKSPQRSQAFQRSVYLCKLVIQSGIEPVKTKLVFLLLSEVQYFLQRSTSETFQRLAR